jgi:MYXO-CTERM domain-containing protein
MASRLALLPALAAAGLLFALPGTAAAEGPEESSDFSPDYEQQLLGFEDVGVDTGWIPNGSPVQMRFFAAAANTIAMGLPGQAHYDWRTQQLRFEGDPNAGYFEYKVGVEIFASVKVDVDFVQWESDILGPYDFLFDEAAMFTPYLLEGNPDRPATITEQSDAFPLASVPIVPDIIIIAGNLDIDLFIDIHASFQCNRIEVLGPDGEIVDFVTEGESIEIDPGEGPEDLIMPATALCQLQTEPTLIINPHLVMEVIGQEYDIAGIDIPVDLPVVDDEVAFDPIDLEFPRWEPDPPTGDTGGETGGDEGGLDEVGDDTGTGGTGDDFGGEYVDDGCNCTTTKNGQRGGLVMLSLFALAGLRRRRRST